MATRTAPVARAFTTCRHTVVAKMTDGRVCNFGTYANYYLAAPVVAAGAACAEIEDICAVALLGAPELAA